MIWTGAFVLATKTFLHFLVNVDPLPERSVYSQLLFLRLKWWKGLYYLTVYEDEDELGLSDNIEQSVSKSWDQLRCQVY